MIKFQKVRWKNFLSTGNAFTEINITATPNALIIGENGAGKSTILDAFIFCLFGKPYRKITKGNLVNSVNNKDCVVEIEFDTNGKSYKIVRGIKPSIFEIYCDGVCLNQDSTVRDYQEYLEKYIIKMNIKSAMQTVILGSASFVPFMQLSAADRRAVIEDLLDIQVFSVMNSIVKQRTQNIKQLIEINKLELNSAEENKSFIEKTIDSLKKNNDEKKLKLLKVKKDAEDHIKILNDLVVVLEDDRQKLLDKTVDLKKLRLKHQELVSLHSKMYTNMENCENELAFFKNNDSCPTCKQAISTECKHDRSDQFEQRHNELFEATSKIVIKLNEVSSKIKTIEGYVLEADDKRNDITSKKSKISSSLAIVADTKKLIADLDSSDKVLSSSEKELEAVIKKINTLEKERQNIFDERLYIETASTLLKDGGIKTRIIAQYLPIINKLINKYLTQMGFHVNFSVDENFEESIKSRYRDEFSYHSFSQGEKFRIDLALLLTWRAIAKMKNSVSTNLLIFDEIFDGSLDESGTDEFLKIMNNMANDTNVLVISHKQDQLLEKFHVVHKFEKTKNFSTMITT